MDETNKIKKKLAIYDLYSLVAQKISEDAVLKPEANFNEKLFNLLKVNIKSKHQK
jgi:hypothetical protein